MKKTPLRLLLVEDVASDAALMVVHLGRGGYDVQFTRVETADAMSVALNSQTWDLVISDYALPNFSGGAAFLLLREKKLDIPFIIVSGAISEEGAVEAMRVGVHDFISKGKLSRLCPAVERELRDAQVRAERKLARDQLVVSDRMASMGTLAAGVAHEINNPLAALLANLEFASKEVTRLMAVLEGDAPPPATAIAAYLREVSEPLSDCRESAERMKYIVRDLRLFSRADDTKHGPVDIRRVIESSLRIGWNEIRHRARLVKDYGEVPAVHGNEARLGQVFLNLIVNAAQSIPEGEMDANEIRITTRSENDRACIEIKDTGAGIAPAIAARIFEPFFTTKPANQGTGLGLAICNRIITDLGGLITVESQVGAGSTFRLTLPLATEAFVAATAAPKLTIQANKGNVLVIDDDPMIGSAVRRVLGDHDVTVMLRAQDALDSAMGGKRFDAILCDLMMPEVTGMDFHQGLLSAVPEQAGRIIFMTGGAFTPSARAFLDKVPNPRVDKPLDTQNLQLLVRSMMR